MTKLTKDQNNHPAPESELKAVVERLNASGYEFEDGPVTSRNASAVVEILLKQLHEAVLERDSQTAPVVPDEKTDNDYVTDCHGVPSQEDCAHQRGWNACRAAMLNGGKKAHPNDGECESTEE